MLNYGKRRRLRRTAAALVSRPQLAIDPLEDRVLLSVTPSVARQWDEELLDAIRVDTPRPPVHARNLFHTSIAMYDAWAAYDATAVGYLTHEKLSTDDVESARNEAISYAAYRILTTRFAHSIGQAVSLPSFDAKMAELGYDASITTLVGNTPAALGNRIASRVLAYGQSDGSLESLNYLDPDYQPVNPPLVFKLPGTTMTDPNRWQPLAFDHLVLQNGIVVGAATQTFVGPHWGQVKPFAIEKYNPDDVLPIDPGPPPMLGTATDAQFKAEAVEVIRYASLLDPTDPTTIDISPGAMWNNSLGTNDGTGYPVNPYTGEPYEPNVVLRGDVGRVLAEFWADGPHSETPPGHWNVLANYVADHPLFEKRIAGEGPIVEDLEWDVKIYLALNGAVHDAAVASWGVKGYYDGTRPISMIRYMGGLGQSSDPEGPSYHPDGLPLEPGLVEVITAATTAPGERHEHLAGHEGEIALYTWRGQPEDPETELGGVGWVRAVEWITYQRNTFVTPPFAGYTSGHSTFSRSAAEVMAHFTGSPYFPGGLGTFTAEANDYLAFEIGPTEDIVLEWATYYDASDQAGISRLWGGIHVAADDFQGRIMGSQIGNAAFARAMQYFNGQIAVERVDAPDVDDVAFQIDTATSTLALALSITPAGGSETPLETQPGSTALINLSGTLRAGIDDQQLEFLGGSVLALPNQTGAFAPGGTDAQAAWQLSDLAGGAAAFAAALRGAALDLASAGPIAYDEGGNFSPAGLDLEFLAGSLLDFAQTGTPGQISLDTLGALLNEASAGATWQTIAGQWVVAVPIDATVTLVDIDGAGTSATLRIAGEIVARAPVLFTEVTGASGIDHVQHAGPTAVDPPYFQPNLTGGGAAGDFDNDGREDLLVTRLDGPPVLYRNRGDGTFQDVTEAAGLAATQLTGSNGAGWADIDNDGDLDLYLTSTGGNRFYLYLNDGHGHFTEEAVLRGAAVAGADEHFGQSVAFGDYDGDGYLDLHVTEWRIDDGVQNPGDAPSNSRLLRNLGGAAPGHFTDVTAAAGVALDGVAGNHEPGTFAASSRWVDFDADGRLDLAVVGDHGETRLFWNNGDGTFTDGTLAALAALPERAFGSAVGDFNGDGLFDWFIAGVFDPGNGLTGNRLYLNDGDRTFTDATDAAGVRDGGYAFGVEAIDFDHDGDLDLALVGGSHFENPSLFAGGAVRLWRNDGDAVFTDVAAATGFSATGEARGLISFDLDHDGDHDLFVVNHAGEGALWRNDGGNQNGWLRIDLRGDVSNYRGVGARIEVTPVAGGPTYTHVVSAGGGFLSHGATEPLIGVGSGSGPIAQVVIRWPSGIVQTLTNVARNKTLVAVEPYDGPTFTDVTEAAGIDYVQLSEFIPSGYQQITFTGGAAAGDYDGDGWVDLFVTRLDAPPILYRNLGDGTFEDVTASTGLDLVQLANSNGAGWADIDNDGNLDLYVTSFSETRFYLYINNGAGQFTEEAVARGAAIEGDDPHFGQSVSFGDYDRDGYLDIHVTEWRHTLDVDNPTGAPSNSRLLRNRGAAAPGQFEDVTVAAGVALDDVLADSQIPGTWAFTSQFADFDDDGWLDLAVVSDFSESRLFWNNGDGTFTDTTEASGVGLDRFGMGGAVADVNGDGRLDWFVTSISAPDRAERHHLYYNQGSRAFASAPGSAGIDDVGWGWAATAIDYDNDGDSDLAYAAGYHGDGDPRFVIDPNGLLRNNGDGLFANVALAAGITNVDLAKGLLTFDYDRDGDLDLFIVNHAAQSVLYRNDGGNEQNWLRVETTGTLSNRDGIGARVTVTPVAGGASYVGEVSASSNYLSQNESTLHFGLGDFAGQVAEVRIRWPSGIVQTFTDVDVNDTLLAVEDGTPPELAVDPGGPYMTYSTLPVQLTASVSGDADLIEWDFDLDGFYDAQGASVDFVAPTGGSFIVRVRALGEGGAATALVGVDVIQLAVDPGGPYATNEGSAVSLSANPVVGTFDAYAWDLDGDGAFETPGQEIIWTPPDNGSFVVYVRASGPTGVVVAPATVEVASVAPSLQVESAAVAAYGVPYTLHLTSEDPSANDLAGSFTYEIDWNGDGAFDETVIGPQEFDVSRVFDALGPVDVRIRSIDKDGASSEIVALNLDVSLAVLAPDPLVGNLVDLVWTGSDDDDRVIFEQLDADTVRVSLTTWNGLSVSLSQTFDGVTRYVVADARAGEDEVDASLLATLAARLQGGLHGDTLRGGGGNDLLEGDPADSGADGLEGDDSLDGGAGADTIYGDGLEGGDDTINGGSGNDYIRADGADGGEGIDLIHGNGGHDTILYGLGNDWVEGDGGDDLIYAGIAGGSGANYLDGGSGNNVVVGSSGIDTITAGSGRDILIGGGGNDGLSGGSGDDLLIGGTTAFDNNAAALLAIRNEWISAAAYATRIAHLTGALGGGLNGGFLLTAGSTVQDDDAIDLLMGQDGLDWFWYHAGEDLLPDYNSSTETRNNT